MEHWIVSASTIDFIADVDKGVRFLNGAFENFKSFFVAQDTLSGSKSFAHADGVATPQHSD